MMLVKIALFSVVPLIVSVLVGCARPQTKASDAPMKFDYYVTWVQKKQAEPAENAVYILNGNVEGRGRDGFLKLLGQLRGAEDGSSVLIFSTQDYRPGYSGPNFDRPFYDMLNELRLVINEKHIHLFECYPYIGPKSDPMILEQNEIVPYLP